MNKSIPTASITDQLDLDSLPEKQYFTASEVAGLCGVKAHVLRFWEQEFPLLRIYRQSRNDRRYYHRDDVIWIKYIQQLLQKGYTLQEVQKELAGYHDEAKQELLSAHKVCHQPTDSDSPFMAAVVDDLQCLHDDLLAARALCAAALTLPALEQQSADSELNPVSEVVELEA